MNTDIGRHLPAVQALRAAVLSHRPEADLLALEQVCEIARQVHQGQVRNSGHPYVVHPLIVATQIASWGRSIDCIYAALLHDVPETSWDVDTFQPQVGAVAIRIVHALKALERGNEPFTLTGIEDFLEPRLTEDVLALKIADRLHNTRTWQFVPRAKARRKARETIDVIAPTADRLGLTDVATELRRTATVILSQVPSTSSASTIHADRAHPLIERRDALGESLIARAYRRALRVLPPADRDRYAYEWAGDLAAVEHTRARLTLALGLIYSAWMLRRRKDRSARSG